MKELTEESNNERMSQLLILIVIASWVDFVSGKATLSLPKSANCGNQAVLTCTSIAACYTAYGFEKNENTIYTNLGPVTGVAPDKYNGTVTSSSTVKLTITNIELSDSGAYKCQCGFDPLSAATTMLYTCKATTSKATVTNEKKLSITVDSLHPQPSSVVTSLTNRTTELLGAKTCWASSLLASHYRCTWVSTESLPDGYHGYTMTVTTGTVAARVTGSVRIVTPISPAISNLVTISNRKVLIGIQDIPLTIQCVSSGGIPAPTLALYKVNTSTSPLAQSRTTDSVQQSDGSYNVTLTHTFRTHRTDDLTTFLCQVFYPGATNGASPDPPPTTALMYLDLKPDIANVSQTSVTVSGGTITLRCTSVNGRPAPNITWSYKGQTFTPTTTLDYLPPSETYTVVSLLQRPVSAADNGQPATCIVIHKTLSEPLARTINVDVNFGPSPNSTTISGNVVTQATGANKIRLNCTSGSSNPASNITWSNQSGVMSNVVGYEQWPGDNHGVITSNILTITPTRYMDGDRITCKIDNGYGSDSTNVDLEILYSPQVQPLLNITSTEGEPDISLTCIASSKPPATFKWTKGDMVLANGMGTITDNSFSYMIPRVDRTDSGSYQCQAGNGVGNSDLKNMYLIVKYPPVVTVSTKYDLVYSVTCTADGFPDSYTYQDWVQIWPGYGYVATMPFTGTTLNLNGSTYESSGVYVCSASNGVAVYDTNMKFTKGNTTVLIKAPPVLTDPSPDDTRVPVAGKLGHDATTKITYWSNVDGSVVKCYKLVRGSRSPSSSCSVTETDTEVTLPVHKHMVTETGALAIIKIHISSQDDIADYDVVVSNSLQGESVLAITIVSQGPPEAPTLFGNFSITASQVILTVVPGFHGGYNQTLVVQISTDLKTWINKTSVYNGLDRRPTDVILGSFRENTLHHVRVFAYNIEGRSNNFSTVMNFTTAKDPETKSSSAALIGSAVGITCALLVVTVLLVVVWRYRKAGWKISQKGDRRSLATERDNTDSVVECAMYVSAGNVQPRTCVDVYSTPQKRGRPDPSANVYAVVSKTKKGNNKREKHGKPTKGLPQFPKVAATTFDTTKKQESNPPPRSLMNVNDDGLIYADLEFDRTAKYDVIHGLDDVTIYVEIDFTKTTEPLPDSDEESTKKK